MPAERLPDHPEYPVYLSKDKQTEVYADTQARCVELEFAGWTRVREPRPATTWAEPEAASAGSRAKKPTTPDA